MATNRTSSDLVEMFASREGALRDAGSLGQMMLLTAKQAAWLFDVFRKEVGVTPTSHGHRFASGMCSLGGWEAIEWKGGAARLTVQAPEADHA